MIVYYYTNLKNITDLTSHINDLMNVNYNVQIIDLFHDWFIADYKVKIIHNLEWTPFKIELEINKLTNKYKVIKLSELSNDNIKKLLMLL